MLYIYVARRARIAFCRGLAYTEGMYDIVIRVLADGLVIPIVIIGIYALLVKVRPSERYAAYCRVLMAGLTSFLLAKLLASAYQPTTERPFEAMQVAAGALYLNNPGFPSDHALFTAAITCAVWFETRSKKLALVLVTMTLLVCVGRVLAHVHTPLDVFGGVAVALLGAMWYFTAPAASSHDVQKRT